MSDHSAPTLTAAPTPAAPAPRRVVRNPDGSYPLALLLAQAKRRLLGRVDELAQRLDAGDASVWADYLDALTCGSTSEVPTGDGFFPNAVPSTETLPNSFYYAARPSAWWGTPWGTPKWPPIGPDVTGGNVTSGSGGESGLDGHADKIPARLCYENAAPDTNYAVDQSGLRPIQFDATVCYREAADAPISPRVRGLVMGLLLLALLVGLLYRAGAFA